MEWLLEHTLTEINYCLIPEKRQADEIPASGLRRQRWLLLPDAQV